MTRPPPRTYRSQVSVEKATEHLYIVRAVPHPVHAAKVAAILRNRRPIAWRVDMMTTWEPMGVRGLTFESALSQAAEWVGRMTGEVIKERFHGVQRTAMGQGKCPHLGKLLCLRAASPGSVWCEHHPHGRKVVNDA